MNSTDRVQALKVPVFEQFILGTDHTLVQKRESFLDNIRRKAFRQGLVRGIVIGALGATVGIVAVLAYSIGF